MMFIGVAVGIFLGFPVAFTLAGMGLVFGVIGYGSNATFYLMGARAFSVMTNYMYIAIPLFIFMGSMLQMSGVADSAFGALKQWMRNIKGGLGIATVVLCVIFGSCVGVVGASVTTMALLTLPPMYESGYKRSLATGIVAAGGTLGILLPPSIMMVVMGPVAGVSIIKLFAGTIAPGLMLGFVFGLYVFIIVRVRKGLVPDVVKSKDEVLQYSLGQGLAAFIPLISLILAVLGAIFFGIASPTEAAAVGALGSVVIAAGYRRLNIKAICDTAMITLRASTMVMFVILGANVFTAVFFVIGGTETTANFLKGMGLAGGGTFAVVLLLVFLLGIFLDWVGVILIVVPVFMPILVEFGFHPLYVSLVILVLLQTSFITPPFAYTMFYIMGVAPPGTKLSDLYKGVVPFIILQLIVVGICIALPDFIVAIPEAIVQIR
jgi:tripartite ATP-independent transporter DctM subunit